MLVVRWRGFGSYLPEIMRAEGLNLFTVGGPGGLTAGTLSGFTSVVLGRADLDSDQVSALSDWVNAGGDLVALRPDPDLAGLLGLTSPVGTLPEGYIKVDTDVAPGSGHRRARPCSSTARPTSTRRRPAPRSWPRCTAPRTTATVHPAVTVRCRGRSGRIGARPSPTTWLSRSC